MAAGRGAPRDGGSWEADRGSVAERAEECCGKVRVSPSGAGWDAGEYLPSPDVVAPSQPYTRRRGLPARRGPAGGCSASPPSAALMIGPRAAAAGDPGADPGRPVYAFSGWKHVPASSSDGIFALSLRLRARSYHLMGLGRVPWFLLRQHRVAEFTVSGLSTVHCGPTVLDIESWLSSNALLELLLRKVCRGCYYPRMAITWLHSLPRNAP